MRSDTGYYNLTPPYMYNAHTIMTARNMQVAFEDTKGVIRIRKLKKNRQHKIGQKKKNKRSNNHLQNIYIYKKKSSNANLVKIRV